jgi:phage terminase large subunit
MKFIATTALKKILALKKRLKIIQGGTSASKTISILTIFIDRAQSRKGHLSSVVSETLPQLKRGAIRDFLNIMEGHGYYKDDCWNKTDFIYTFETGSKIEFFSADSPDKVRGPRRNGDLFLNECNNIQYDTYTQLAIRTEGDIYLDYNPVAEFWVQEEVIPKLDHDFLILTYKDNEGLPQSIINEIESRKDSVLILSR